MIRNIKLIWDFRGPVALKTAEHHIVHLSEFIEVENIPTQEIAAHEISEFHSIAYMVIPETHLLKVRDALKPHRAVVAPTP